MDYLVTRKKKKYYTDHQSASSSSCSGTSVVGTGSVVLHDPEDCDCWDGYDWVERRKDLHASLEVDREVRTFDASCSKDRKETKEMEKECAYGQTKE